MPYDKRKQGCKQTDGTSGEYILSYTTKKGKKTQACHTSKKKMQGQIAAIEAEADELEDKNLIGDAVITEKKLRKMVRNQIKSTILEVKDKFLFEQPAEDKDFNLEELEGLNLPTVLKKLLDPNITPAKYADIDAEVDASGNINHQGFAIAAFALSYADMDGSGAESILAKAKAIIPKIIKAREKKEGKL